MPTASGVFVQGRTSYITSMEVHTRLGLGHSFPLGLWSSSFIATLKSWTGWGLGQGATVGSLQGWNKGPTGPDEPQVTGPWKALVTRPLPGSHSHPVTCCIRLGPPASPPLPWCVASSTQRTECLFGPSVPGWAFAFVWDPPEPVITFFQGAHTRAKGPGRPLF